MTEVSKQTPALQSKQRKANTKAYGKLSNQIATPKLP